MKQINILITSAGVATAVNVIKSLQESNHYNCKIIATDMNEYSAGLYLADKYFISPSVKTESFLSFLKSIILKERIDFIFPIHSSEIEFFSKNKLFFEKLNAGIIIPTQKTIKKCNNKDSFQIFLKNNNFYFPKTYSSIDEIKSYPVFIKPKTGSSSIGANKIENKEQLQLYFNNTNNHYIIQDFIDWPEITIDCYVNKNRKLVGFVPRFRIKIKDGKSVVSKTMFDENVLIQTKKILSDLKYTGACNVQMFYKEGNIKIIEVNPRLSAGGLPLCTRAGVNIPELMIRDYFNELDDNLLSYNKNLTMIRYLTETYL